MTRTIIRRSFLRDAFLVAAGGVFGSSISSVDFRPGTESMALGIDNPIGPEQRLIELGIELPAPPKPVAIYVPVVISGNLLFTSGQGPRQLDGTMLQGKIGTDLTLEEGRAAARLVGLGILSSIREAVASLDKVVRLVKVLGMVNCSPEFTQHPQVINGFSELMVDIFGEKAGKGARSAVGMGSLPGNIPVEIEAIFEYAP